MKKIVIIILILLGIIFFFPKTKTVGTFDGPTYRGEPLPKCFGFSKGSIIPYEDGTGFTCYGVFY